MNVRPTNIKMVADGSNRMIMFVSLTLTKIGIRYERSITYLYDSPNTKYMYVWQVEYFAFVIVLATLDPCTKMVDVCSTLQLPLLVPYPVSYYALRE